MWRGGKGVCEGVGKGVCEGVCGEWVREGRVCEGVCEGVCEYMESR